MAEDVFVGQPRRGIERLLDEIKHLEALLAKANMENRAAVRQIQELLIQSGGRSVPQLLADLQERNAQLAEANRCDSIICPFEAKAQAINVRFE